MHHFPLLLLFLFLVNANSTLSAQRNLFEGKGTVTFLSEAPLEKITATSDELMGILDLESLTFAFSCSVNTFNGFNSPLQQEHFNEHYLETEAYPKAVFSGKIVGLDDCRIDCDKEIFAKGILQIHGIAEIVTIPIRFKRTNKNVQASAHFSVLLEDYNIEVPLILEAKISPIIAVDVEIVLKKKDA